MGILNVTPDSFFDQGRFFNVEAAIQRGKEMIDEGVDIIDIGGESTRPGASPVSEQDELDRVLPVIQALHAVSPVIISIDTRHPYVARAAVQAGATLINDVSGFLDPAMEELAASTHVPICVMHMQGTPLTMQKDPHYPEGIIAYLLKWFESRVSHLVKQGVKEEQIILDPGIGFGKTVADNLEIIENLPQLKAMGFPLLIGVSRKSFMGKILNKTPSELLPATLAMNTFLIISAVDIIRVHDVAEHRAIIDLLSRLSPKILAC